MSAEKQTILLVWSEPTKPNEECWYDHCIAETPFGRFLITWKSWKEFDDYCVDSTPWGGFMSSYGTLKEAQEECQAEFDKRLLSCLQ